MRYELREMIQWRNTVTSATASIFGACPWTSDAERPQWIKEPCGYGYTDTIEGTHHGRHGTPRSEAQTQVDRMNASYEARQQAMRTALHAKARVQS